MSKIDSNEIGISVITTHYNNIGYLENLIESFRKLEINHPCELIVIDDGSSGDVKKAIPDDLKNIRFFSNEKNMGVQYSRNRGLHLAKYKYCFVVDGDDMFSEESTLFLNRGLNILEHYKGVAFVHGFAFMFDGCEGLTISSYPLNARLIAEMHHVPTSILYRRDEAIAAGGYNEDICKWQDWAFGVALLNYRLKRKMGMEISFIPQKAYLYRCVDNAERLSVREVSIQDVVSKVVSLYYPFFKSVYSEHNHNEMVDIVLHNKPNRLIELLHVAEYDHDLAVEIIKERDYDVTHDPEKEWIP